MTVKQYYSPDTPCEAIGGKMDEHCLKPKHPITRRDMLKMIGIAAGSAALYHAMTDIGFTAESTYKGPMKLEGKPKKGSSVIILGAGISGMLAAYELGKAGYSVSILEYREKEGGRCWTLRGGDTFTELGGATQHCAFDTGGYLNPGPWRIPYHHYAIMDYCRELGVELEPFTMINFNAYAHDPNAFEGKPQRIRHIMHDYQGGVAELLAKAVSQDKLDDGVTTEDKEKLLESLRNWGVLDKDFRYVKSRATSVRRGYDVDPGGGLMPEAVFSQPLAFKDVLNSSLWKSLSSMQMYEYQQALFEPRGGMDMIAKGFGKKVGRMIRFHSKVTRVAQDEKGVTVTYTDLKTGKAHQAKADWCVCTIPLSILSQLDVQVSREMKAAIDAVPYETGFKAGLQFKRRFWEEDDRIFGGVTFTSSPLRNISYPSFSMNRGGKGVLLGAYMFGPDSYKLSAMEPKERLNYVLHYGRQIHPQYDKEFENGITVGWHRVPWTNGCHGMWTEDSRAAHYKTLCDIDGRIIMAGEHVSHIPAWLEGAALSGMNAVERLHKRVLAG